MASDPTDCDAAASDPPVDAGRGRRRYDSPVRRRQAAETRRRIVDGGAALIHNLPIWNWRELTVRAVAKRAGVNERTVYRYFPSERELHAAVLERLREEAGVELDGLRLDDLRSTTERILEYASGFPLAPRQWRDPAVASENERQRRALLEAVAPHTSNWLPAERAKAAAIFDLLWNPVSYERLVGDWELTPAEAISAITWVVGILEHAIRDDNRPE